MTETNSYGLPTAPGVDSVANLYFGSAPASITGLTPHDWQADAQGKYHTLTDLKAEWIGLYQQMLDGHGATLTAVQRLEGNAQAVFENTRLSKLSDAEQRADREDMQREFDAIAGAMKINQASYGIDPNAPLTLHSYIQLGRTLQSNVTLFELGLQGHGLNNPPAPKYSGYTNDFQNNVDGTTLFVGGGLSHNQNVLADFVDDSLISHLPFSVVFQNGQLTQLNQNGNAESSLEDAIVGLDDTMFYRTFTAADFSTTPSTKNADYESPAAELVHLSFTISTTPGHIATLYGDIIDNSVSGLTPHDWKADAKGLFHTTTDLKAEWGTYYDLMQAGKGNTLTAVQRMEGNAEVVFRNTGLNRLSAAQQKIDREDLQREFDAIDAALKINAGKYGFDPAAPLTKESYLALERTIQTSPVLLELGLQGHGLNNPPASRYRGFTNDFQNNVDNRTLFIGGGMDYGQRALPDVVDDSILTHLPFATVFQNGHLEQLNQNGNAEDRLRDAIIAADDTMYGRVYRSSEFAQTLPAAGRPAYASPNQELVDRSMILRADSHSVTTLEGDVIADTITFTPHQWIADAYGRFHTATDLAAEWGKYYTIMQSGGAASLTALQRLEGNAEAVFRNTGLKNLSEETLRRDREDAQREFDAIAAGMTRNTAKGIDPTKAFTLHSYIELGRTIQGDSVLAELAVQGHGLNNPPASRYRGYTNDFQNNVDNTTLFVGGGSSFGEAAISGLFDDAIMSHLPFAVVFQDGRLVQLNQNGDAESTVVKAIVSLDDTMFGRVYRPADFATKAPATAPAYTSPFQAMVEASTHQTAGAHQIVTLYGDIIADTITGLTLHDWVADSTGLFHTKTDLAAEWGRYYDLMQAGKAGSLTEYQRMEGNAEAVFRNTGLSKQSKAQQLIYREDVQRSIDAVAGAARLNQANLGIASASPLFINSYLKLEHTLQGNAVLQELGLQGHGLNNAPATRYRGFTNDFQNNVDNKTRYIGGGPGNGQNALATFFDDTVLTHTPFASIFKNGAWRQLNQNGNVETTVKTAVQAMNNTLFYRTFVAADFKK